MADQIPRAVFIGLNKNADSVVQSMLGTAPQLKLVEEHFYTDYIWNIRTKYYTTDIKLCVLIPGFVPNIAFKNTVQAVIVYFDTNKGNGLLEVNNLMHSFNFKADVKILTCDKIRSNTPVPLSTALDWCLARGFELVDLNPEIDDEEKLSGEKYGVNRIIDALHSHVWPNAKMISHDDVDGDNIDDNATDQFCEMFSRLGSMMGDVRALPHDQRLDCAEHILTAFWKAIDGADEELMPDADE